MISSIKNKLLTYLTGIIIFVSLVIGLSSYLLMNKYLTEMITDELILVTQMTSSTVEQYFEQKKDILERVGQGHELEEYVYKYKPLPLIQYFSKFRHEFPLFELALVEDRQLYVQVDSKVRDARPEPRLRQAQSACSGEI